MNPLHPRLSPLHLRALAGVAALGCLCHAPAVLAADDPPQDEAQAAPPVLNYALGAIISTSPDYAGGAGRKNSLRPAWAVEYGRFRLSTSRGSAFMGHGLRPRESGASATLAESDRFHVSASLRIDKGRDGSDASILVGLPSVRSTLRARVSGGYALTDRLSVGVGVSQDLLGRDGGAQASVSMGYAWPVTEQTRVTFGAGASMGDKTYLRGHFGVPANSATGLPAFSPGGGVYSVDAGVEVMSAINRHWVVYGAARVSRLQGDARRSPVVVDPTGYSVSVGLAYRCCR
ncbi:MipA/OmpV family protein [Paracidovorax sp. MALMAid1276]|uniref:MipA/OmpV family protein n=1 Tax=Paracidovorax sp. MALMAid1276 TaxID=3411631 RepID=UPI003B9C106C